MNTNKHKTAQPVKDSKEKLQEWENMLVGKDKHSIRNQIQNMIWDSAVFQCINESKKYAAKDDKGNIKQNGMIHYFITQSFFKTQLLSIRNLTDKDFNKVQKDKPYTVYSLYNLIEDMKKNSMLLTRKNILAAYNLPYDYEKAMADLDNNTDYTKGAVIVPPEIARSQEIHRRIDSMAEIAADKRSPDNLVPDNILKQFDDKLASIEELCEYVNKFIAHAATPDSRKAIPDEIKGALGEVLNAHKIIYETASFIGNNLLFCGFGVFLPPPRYGQLDQFDLFEYLDEPIASKETAEKLKEFWEKYKTETKQWCK
jgi:hypothetical protein